jgi:hypothetical protein
VQALPFDDVVADEIFLTELERREESVDGRDALRLESLATGADGRPPGIPVVTWAVDLGAATLTATANDVGEPAFAEKVDVLDTMMEHLVLPGI